MCQCNLTKIEEKVHLLYCLKSIQSVESFKKEFKKTEVDISKHFDTDYETLIQTTLDKGIQDENPPAMNFEQPKTLFDEADFEMWSFE